MKPQQQNTDLIGHSHVYVQKPDGEEINVPIKNPNELAGEKDEEVAQTASHTPTKATKEVTDGEDA